MSVMEHLFKFLLLAPYFYFDNWIEKANRNSKFFPIFYYFYWFYIPFYSLFSLAWTVVSVLFFNTVFQYRLEKCDRYQVMGHLVSFYSASYWYELVNLFLFQRNVSLETGTREV